MGQSAWIYCELLRIYTWSKHFVFVWYCSPPSLVPRLFPPPVLDLVSFPNPPKKWKRVWCSEWHFLSNGVGPYIVRHNCIFKYGTWVSDALVHMDYYIAPLAKACDDHKVYWASRKWAVRQVFPTSNLVTSCKYTLYLHLLRSDWWSQIWDRPCPVWQEMLLRTPDPLCMCGGFGQETIFDHLWYANTGWKAWETWFKCGYVR